MKILILGAGQVGKSVAAALVKEDNDVTIIDTNAEPYANYAKSSMCGLSWASLLSACFRTGGH